MVERLPLVVLAVFCVMSAPVSAQSIQAVLRSGEHAGFTRLTIQTDLPTSHLAIRPVGEKAYDVTLSRALDQLDVSRLFDRLNAGRITSVDWTGDVLNLRLGCDCGIAVANAAEDLLVIDISEPTEEVGEIEEARTVTASPVARPEEIVPFRVPEAASFLPDAWSIDHALVDRISSEISDHLMPDLGLISLPEPAIAEPLPKVPLDGGDGHIVVDLNQETCEALQEIWRIIEDRTVDVYPVDVYPPPDSIAGSDMEERISATGFRLSRLVASGLLAEVSGMSDASDKRNEPYRSIAAILVGTEVTNASSINPSCGPFARVVRFVMQQTEVSDMTGDQSLDLYHTFEDLPLGLQLALFRRFAPLVQHVSREGFEDLFAHSALEEKLVASLGPSPADMSVSPSTTRDADAIAAIARELRGTHAEEASLLATFDAFLSEGRFFEARELLSDVPDEERSGLTSRLLLDLAENADSITFLSIVIDEIENEPNTSWGAVSAQVMRRLVGEGFADRAVTLFELIPADRRDSLLLAVGARAYLDAGRPEAALKVLETQDGDAVDALRAEAFAGLEDFKRAVETLPSGATEEDRDRWRWMAGQFAELADTETASPIAAVADLLSSDEVPDPPDVTVATAQAEVAHSSLIRSRLADLVRANPSR